MNLKNKLKNSVIFGQIFVAFGLNYPVSIAEEVERTPEETILKCAEHFEKLSNYKPLKKQEIDSVFSFLNPGLREHLKKVYFIKEKDFFYKNAVGEAHGLEDLEGVICLADSSKETAYHESAHIRHFALNKNNSDFSKRWKKIANFEYGTNNIESFFLKDGTLLETIWKDDSIKCPKNGLLNPYSAKSIGEDISEFVQSLGYVDKKEEAKGITCQNMIYQLFFCDTNDKRYQKKLDLLKEYNFLTKEEHEKLSKNLGSLNYLLKQKK